MRALGNALTATGRADEAIAFYHHALQLEPAESGQNPRSVLMRVDLPAPFGPRSPMVDPESEQLRSFKICRFPIRTEKPRSSITGGPTAEEASGGIPLAN